jgi:hypothetical protein
MLKSSHCRTAFAAIICALLCSTFASAQIELHEKLTLSGWIDMSWQRVDDGATTRNEEDFFINEVEFDLDFDLAENLTARVDISFNREDTPDNFEGDIEQAYFTYTLNDQTSVTAGKFLSYLGWEAFDVINLYQISGGGGQGLYPSFQNGVRLDHNQDMFQLGLAVVGDVYNKNAYDTDDRGYEAKVKYMPVEDATIFLGYAQQAVAGSSDDIEVLNIWASYKTGDLLLAAEYMDGEDYREGADQVDIDGFLAMANYTINENWQVTVRYTERESELSATGVEQDDSNAWVVAPAVTITDNLDAIFEYRQDEVEDGEDTDTLTLKLILTF